MHGDQPVTPLPSRLRNSIELIIEAVVITRQLASDGLNESAFVSLALDV